MLKKTKASCSVRHSNSHRGAGTILTKPKSTNTQTLLAVARQCRECGEKLTGIEGAMHNCRKALHWPFGCREIPMNSSPNSKFKTKVPNGCRIARLAAANIAGGSASARFDEMWAVISKDLSHCLGAPSLDELGSGDSFVLLVLHGREVEGLLWAERLTEGIGLREATPEERCLDTHKNMPPQIEHGTGQMVQRLVVGRRGMLGVRLIWVHRPFRKKGLARCLVD